MLLSKSAALTEDHWTALLEAVEQATPDQCPMLMGRLEQLKTSLWLKLSTGTASQHVSQADRLLTAEELADRLHVTKGFVYRNAGSYPFTIRQGRYLRFSHAGLERYLKQRQGR